MNLGLGLTWKISHFFTWKKELSLSQGFAGVLLVAFSVNKCLSLPGGAVYRETFSVLQATCRCKSTREWQTNGGSEASSLGTRGSFLCAWATGQAYFFLDLLHEFGVSFLPKSTNRNLFYL